MNASQSEELQSHYEGRYISLKKMKVDKENEGCKEKLLEEDLGESIRPYMSEEIHSVLKAMGEYLLDESSEELAATISDEITEEVPTELQEKSLLEQFREKQNDILKGRVLTKHIICKGGEYIGRQGEIITEQMIQVAKENGCIIKMIMYSE